MRSLTLSDLDDALYDRLVAQAQRHGRTVEAEAAALLTDAVPPAPTSGAAWLARLRARFEPLGGVDLEIPPRDMPRRVPDLSD